MYSKEVIEGFMKVSTASVSDAVDKIAGRRGYMDHDVKPRISDKKIVGPAVTILEGPTDEFVPPKHALDAIDECPEGSVIVISVHGEKNVAVWGGLMTAGAEVNGLSGAVLDGGVRDVTEIRRDSHFQVFARSVSPATTLGRFKTLSSNEPVLCGGIMVHPGDLVVGDLDGVVVVPKAHVEGVLKMATEIEVREAEQAKLIRQHKSLREGLAKYGRI
jgi:regulator of RNase E activity RraA